MDISSLRERSAPGGLTVSELNSYIKRIFDSDKMLKAITVRGEISNFTYHRSGHLYFSLKDEESQIKAVMFRSSASNLAFMPENGMKVIARCSVGVYSQGGVYQLYVNSLQPDGIGALYLAYEQLKEKLSALGMFDDDHKKLLPKFPKRIGVITSPTGAAVRDIINVTRRRYPIADVYLYPSLVQGDGAEGNLIEALDYFNSSRLCDVIILGRGGGSIEDLWAFNSERLAYKIYESEIPVISAVGHETDFTIADFVADLRAPTPSAAAELAVPDIRELAIYSDSLFSKAERALIGRIEKAEGKLENIKNKSVLKDPDSFFLKKEEKLDRLSERISHSVEAKYRDSEARFSAVLAKIDALSPLATLARGYSYTSIESKNLRSVDSVVIGDKIKVTLNDGELDCAVEGVRRK